MNPRSIAWKFPVALALLWAMAVAPDPASAVGTLAGTVISNQATATYTDSNNNLYTPASSNIVQTVVSQVAGINLTPSTGSHTSGANTNSYYSLSLTNTGNGNDTINVSASGLPAGWTYTIYQDLNGDGVLSDADKVSGAYVTLGNSVSLNADSVVKAIVVITSSSASMAGDTGTLTVTATSTFSGGTTATANFTTTVQAAVITVTKTSTPSNPLPGDTVTYTISYSNDGTASGYVLLASDPIPSGTTFVPGSIKLNSVTKTDAADGDEADYNLTSPGTVTVNIGTIGQAQSGTISFQVTINPSLAAGASVGNTANVSYRTNAGDPATTITVNTNTSTITVARMAGVQVSPATLTTDQLPNDLNLHPFTVKNTGNAADTFNFSSVGLYWTWTIYNDVNQDGKYTAGVDTLATDTNADSKKDTGVLLPGETKSFVATTTVVGYDGQQGRHTLTATSVYNGAISATSIKYTNIHTPIIALTKSVSPTGTQPPGTELTYAISVSNTGSATAQAIVVSDILSSYLQYTPASITLGGAPQTDAADGDFGRYDTTTGTVFVNLTALTSGSTVPVTFKAKVK